MAHVCHRSVTKSACQRAVTPTGVCRCKEWQSSSGVDAEPPRVRRQDAERFIEEIRGDDPELAKPLRIEERELEADGGT